MNPVSIYLFAPFPFSHLGSFRWPFELIYSFSAWCCFPFKIYFSSVNVVFGSKYFIWFFFFFWCLLMSLTFPFDFVLSADFVDCLYFFSSFTWLLPKNYFGFFIKQFMDFHLGVLIVYCIPLMVCFTKILFEIFIILKNRSFKKHFPYPEFVDWLI